MDAAVLHAHAIGICELFLYSPDQEAFYARRGWQAVGRDPANGEDNVVMKLRPDAIDTISGAWAVRLKQRDATQDLP